MKYDDLEEYWLLKLISQGNHDAFWQLWLLHKDYLYYRCLSWMGSNHTEAKNLLSQASLKAYEKLPHYASKIINVKEAIKKDVQPILLVQSEAKGENLHNQGRKCFYCQSTHISKNGKRRGKQNYKCKKCDRQFVESYSPKGYATEMKEYCLNLHSNGMGFRAIERETGVSHNTVINWLKKVKIPPLH